MNTYPHLEISLDKIKNNALVLMNLCNRYNIYITAVVKGIGADPKIVSAIMDTGIKSFGDSNIMRIRNLKKSFNNKIECVMLRTPMPSQAKEVVKWADVSIVGSIEALCALNNAALRADMVHKGYIMIEFGDRREGLMPNDVNRMIETAQRLKNIEIIGIAANFACFTGIIPTPKHLHDLISIARRIEENYGIYLNVISGGNSANIQMLLDGTHPKEINNLRIGEGIICGRESLYRHIIKGCYHDTFVLRAEVIEVHEKPTIPGGRCAQPGFGPKRMFKDRGIRRQAVLAVGIEDTEDHGLIPRLKGAEIIGATSNHLILDIHQCHEDIRVGDIIEFDTLYPAIMRGMLSKNLKKIYI